MCIFALVSFVWYAKKKRIMTEWEGEHEDLEKLTFQKVENF